MSTWKRNNGSEKVQQTAELVTEYGQTYIQRHGGLTKRELFAAMAMQGLLSAGRMNPDIPANAVLAADLLLADLERTA